MTPRYRTAAAFKQALEQRIRAASVSGADFGRRRQLVVFDRFLARVALELGDAVSLKGGLALELRLARARTTRDVDLRVTGAPETLLKTLRLAARRRLGDFMGYTIRPDPRRPGILNDGVKYEGQRFRAECTLAGKVYGRPFGVDVAFGDPVYGEPHVMVSPDTLGFAGIAPPTLRVYPIETHIAEKLHVYTMPRGRLNTRVKDLPDLALIAMTGSMVSDALHAAIELTFAFRGTHPVPETLPEPPQSWAESYAAMARDDRLMWGTINEVFEAARVFLQPVLSGGPSRVWAPDTWSWSGG